MFGSATKTKNRELIIYYDYTALRVMPRQFQQHVLYHECAHVELGHLSEETIRQRMLGYTSQNPEDQADCHAMKRLVNDKQYTTADIAEIKRGMQAFSHKETAIYHSVDKRIELLYNCLN
jgi:CRISPR/Cas system CSM-associated protein Csm3 (group 7 of RAMP superfamily)